MGLKDLFRKGELKEQEKTKEKEGCKEQEKQEAEAGAAAFVLGVLDVFPLLNSDDLVVTGRVKGTVHVNDAVYLSNPGEDENQVVLTQVVLIETGPGVGAKEATDCQVGLRIENGKLHKIKKGTVLFSRETSEEEVHNAYISALGDSYVARQKLVLSEKELEELSITDCAEIWRLFAWFQSKVVKTESEEARKENRRKVDSLGAALCKKILNADAVYCVFNKDTGEPHMFSRTIDQKDGTYRCTPPDIMIITEAYKPAMTAQFPENKFEIKKIENGEEKKGIYNFLGSSFYLNGACGICILSEQASIAAPMLVPKPDYSNVRPQDIPVTNPDLVRWMLLLGQIGKPEGNDAELIYKLYYRFMAQELVKARFLIPTQKEGEIPKGDENGKTVPEKNVSFKFPTMDGKYGRPAVRMYTDWKRLRMVYGEEWSALVQPVEGMIGVFDCAVNVTEFARAGCYIGAEMFEEIKKMG